MVIEFRVEKFFVRTASASMYTPHCVSSVTFCRVKDLCMTDDLLKEEDKRLLLFSVSSDGDLRGWAFNPDNVRISACF